MTLQGQLAQSQTIRQFVPSASPLGATGVMTDQWPALESPSESTLVNVGMLGNKLIQFHAAANRISPSTTGLHGRFRLDPALKLALLKQQRFSPGERQQRIAMSLAALNAPQPIGLTIAQWKEVVEEIEDED